MKNESTPGGCVKRKQHRFQKRDLLWLLAYPLYQVIGMVCHEASHALLARVEGARIEQFVVLPSTAGGQFSWGHVSWSGSTDWVPLAAPYLCDLLTYLLFFFPCTRLPFRRHWVWVNAIILGLVSPLVNSGYHYLTAFIRPGSDIAQALHELLPPTVHSYFGVTLLLYVLGLLALLAHPSRVLTRPTPEAQPTHLDG